MEHPSPAPARPAVDALLLGTALGDALGLPAEGLPPAKAARFAHADRFRLAGRTGYVSDDTEQAALIAHAVLAGGSDDAAIVRHFRRALGRWFLRLPFGIGFGTLRACLKNLLGWRVPGVDSAGNGAAMRAPILGLLIPDRARRVALGRALAQITHTDPRAVDGALYCAELAAHARLPDRSAAAARALEVVEDPRLADAIERAIACAREGIPDAAALLGTTGYIMHTVAWTTYVWLRAPDDAMRAIEHTIAGGGDTDTHAAIVGAWMGARHGITALDADLVAALHDGPFGPTHLRALAAAADGGPIPRFSGLRALGRNLMLYPVVLAHGFRRLWPL